MISIINAYKSYIYKQARLAFSFLSDKQR
ncbi:hypothetical protein KPSB59_930016 [Klebsiella quasipneumoniae subsp. quasipneumoniae]|nr:hypothetical protein KPSB59_930016 [Klebsiella quasipneumoniae subsp. quasipneumoniae]